MSTPTATPAKAAKKAAKATEKPAAPAFDFSGIAVEDGTAPTRTGSRTAGPNPFVAHVQASADKRTTKPGGAWIGQGKTLTVPADQAKQAVNLIRYAANKLGMGVTVSDIEDPAYKVAGGKVRIDFAAKNRKQKRTTNTTNNGV